MIANLPNICFIIGVVATALFVVKIIVMFFVGGDAEIETDFNDISESDVAFNFFSVQSVLAFLMGFGWVCLAMLTEFQLRVRYSILIAFCVGLFFMYMSAYLMFLIRKLDKRVKVKLEDYIGTEGKSYSAFKPHSEGQIEVTINKKLVVINAINSNDCEIEAFVPIKIVEVKNNNVYIERV